MVVFGASGDFLALPLRREKGVGDVDDGVVANVVDGTDGSDGGVVVVQVVKRMLGGGDATCEIALDPSSSSLVTAIFCQQKNDGLSCIVAFGTVKKELVVVNVFESGDDGKLEYSIVGKRSIEKKLTHFQLVDEQSILLADKSGDVYRFDFDGKGASESLSPICGHISILTGFARAGPRLLTADRDGKIRISQFPNAFCVEAYCLGHEEFISSVDVTSDNKYVVSGSGDGTLKLWNITNGEELSTFNIPIGDTAEQEEEKKEEEKERMEEKDGKEEAENREEAQEEEQQKRTSKESRTQYSLTNTPQILRVIESTVVFVNGRGNSVFTIQIDERGKCFVEDSLLSINLEGKVVGTNFTSITNTLWVCLDRDGVQVLVPVSISSDGRCAVDSGGERVIRKGKLASEEVGLADLFHTNQDETDSYFSRKQNRQHIKRGNSSEEGEKNPKMSKRK
eukprot:m.18278 g.18278  ORF g.18278 m.18278 type:complete len:452 (+) comp4941_c0_seq1:19-1374(+)